VVCTTIGSKYLSKAIESVLQQKNNDFILTIVDDSGKFLSKRIIKKYKDDRINLIFNKINQGQAKSLNIGINSIESDYVSIIDEDDYWISKNKLNEQVKFLLNEKSCNLVSDRKIIIDTLTNETLNNGNNQFFGRLDSLKYLTKNNPLNHSSVLFKRKVFFRLGCYDETLNRAQDLDLWIRFFLDDSKSIYIRKEITLCYRVFSSKIKILKLYKDHKSLTKIKKKYKIKNMVSNLFIVFIIKRALNYILNKLSV